MSWIQKLGYAENTKLLIIHADDAGLSHSENKATMTSLKNGVVNSYSIMSPCPWFYEMAQFAKQQPQYDQGIHLTLTCEWNTYKFGPVLSTQEVPSLVDGQGYFHQNRAAFNKYSQLDDIEKEMHAQIKLQLDFGLKPTHIDCHMFTLGSKPKFLKLYKKLGKQYKLPVFLNEGLSTMFGLTEAKKHFYPQDFLIDKVYMGNFEDFKNGCIHNYYENTLNNLEAGLNIILIHPAYNNHEMQGITIEHPNFGAEWRQIDFDFFNSNATKEQLKQNNITMLTWREIKTALFK